jgi:hypothetical protein
VVRCNNNPLHLHLVGRRVQNREGRKKERKKERCEREELLRVVRSRRWKNSFFVHLKVLLLME